MNTPAIPCFQLKLSSSDMTPLVQQEGVEADGGLHPRDARSGASGAVGRALTLLEIREGLHERMRRKGRCEKEMPSDYGVRKYLKL